VLSKEGDFEDGDKVGEWKYYDLEGVFYLLYTFNKGVLTDAKLVGEANGYYEYMSEYKDEAHSFSPVIEYKSSEEYKETEDLIRKNFEILKSTASSENRSLLCPFTMLWISNCPYLGKFNVYMNKFMTDYSFLEKDYKYQAQMLQMYMLGLGAYILENKGQIKNITEYHETAYLL